MHENIQGALSGPFGTSVALTLLSLFDGEIHQKKCLNWDDRGVNPATARGVAVSYVSLQLCLVHYQGMCSAVHSCALPLDGPKQCDSMDLSSFCLFSSL